MRIRKEKTISEREALEKLEYLCAQSEQCQWGVREKLWKRGFNSTSTNKIIESLINQRFIDDSRFARQYCRQKLYVNHWGRKKIALMLASKRIDRATVAEVLDEIDEDEYIKIVIDTARNKARQIKEGNTYEGRTKLFRHLLSRGFESATISSIIRNPENSLWDS